jgi:hypothetical protein
LADDLVERTRHELQQRIAELETLTAELPRLKAALAALGGEPEGPRQSRARRSSAAGNGRQRRRRPRGANRAAILALIGERPGVSVGEVAAAVEKQGVKKAVTYSTVNKLAKDGVISKDKGSLTVTSSGRAN